MQFVLLIGTLAFAYLVFLRPQQKRVNQQRNLVSSVEVEDEVVTVGGIVGKVVSLDEEYITLEICPEVNVKFLKIAINKKISSSEEFLIDSANTNPKEQDEVEATFDDKNINSEVDLNTKDEIIGQNPIIINPDNKKL